MSLLYARRAGLAALLLFSVSVGAAAQEASVTATDVREAIARRVGTWITSNAQYRTAENGEPEAYGTHFRTGLGAVSTTGCLWGQTRDQVVGVYWHFFTGWDPETSSILVYQSGQSGVVGIGRERLAAPGNPDVAEQVFAPLPGARGTPFRLRHVSTWIGSDTLRTESFDWKDGGWTPRRTYMWVRRPDVAAPCAGPADR